MVCLQEYILFGLFDLAHVRASCMACGSLINNKSNKETTRTQQVPSKNIDPLFADDAKIVHLQYIT